MTKLISKVQYKNFEAEEFTDVQERSYEETIDLIEKFPWNDQRENIVIDLTNPSVTIEGKNNDFLKLALYFNQKYVLHYFDEKQALFTKSFYDLSEGYKYIKNYFDQSTFDTGDFKKETTWWQHNRKHFATSDFRYVLTPGSVTKYLLSTCGPSFLFSIAFLIVFFTTRLDAIGIIILVLAMFLLGGGLNSIFFVNYYNYAKDKILIMAKGNDTFYFGDLENPVEYNKKDILQYRIVKFKNARNPFGGFAIAEIVLKNGPVLTIPNILIDYSEIELKLLEYPRVEENRLPIV